MKRKQTHIIREQTEIDKKPNAHKRQNDGLHLHQAWKAVINNSEVILYVYNGIIHKQKTLNATEYPVLLALLGVAQLDQLSVLSGSIYPS